MSLHTPNTDLWLERSRLAGMVLPTVSYVPTIHPPFDTYRTVPTTRHHLYFDSSGNCQCRSDSESRTTLRWQDSRRRWFGFAGNARYTEMIWIDLRYAPGGPAALILDEMDYCINMTTALTQHVLQDVFAGGYRHRGRML